MLTSIFAGLLLAMVTIVIHAMGTTAWLRYLARRSSPASNQRKLGMVSQLGILCLTACVLLLLHILEVVVWSVVYLLLVGGEDLATFEESVYFSTVTFTALGYGDVIIEGPWRLLGAIQAMTGLLVFGWSTALLFAVVARIMNLSIDEDGERKENA